MKDIYEPELQDRITSFLNRKTREFPELDQAKQWFEYELTPRRKAI